MGMFYAYGGALIDEDEIQAKTEAGHFAHFARESRKNPDSATIEFSTGRMLAGQVPGGSAAGPQRTTFEPIGVGRPLTIEIRHIYTGRFPKTNLFNRNADMIVTSAIKSSPVLAEAATAVNFLRKQVTPRTGFSTPHADELGTPVVFYSPSLTQKNSNLTIKFAFDDFPGDELDAISQALSTAAGLPLFAAAGLQIHSVAAIARWLGRLGESVFDSHAAFRSTQSLTFCRPGSTIPVANFALMMQDDEDERRILKNHEIRDGILVNPSSGSPYDGDVPYVVISLDGRRNDELKDFAAKSTAAMMLGEVYADANRNSSKLEDLEQAVGLYHDYRIRRRADRIATQLADEPAGTAEFERLAREHSALIANIASPLLKPRVPARVQPRRVAEVNPKHRAA